MNFSCKETADLVTFTEEILNVKLNFLCSDIWRGKYILNSNSIKTIIIKVSELFIYFSLLVIFA